MGTNPVRSPLTALVYRLLPRLRYPYLFLIMGSLFLVLRGRSPGGRPGVARH